VAFWRRLKRDYVARAPPPANRFLGGSGVMLRAFQARSISRALAQTMCCNFAGCRKEWQINLPVSFVSFVVSFRLPPR